MKTKIYILCEPDGRIRYVGKTKRTLQARFCAHLSDSRLGDNTHRCRWIRTIIRNGYLPIIQLIGEVDGDGNKEEIAWIDYFRAERVDLVNTTDGGDGTTGHIVTEETRQKIARSHFGKPMLTLRGVPRSKEIIEKIRQSHLGKKLSLEHIKAMTGVRHKMSTEISRIASERASKRYSDPMERKKCKDRMLKYWSEHKGREVSEETRQKQSLSHLGKKGYWTGKKRPPHSEATRQKVREAQLRYWKLKKGVA